MLGQNSTRILPPTAEISSPFATDASSSVPLNSIEFRPLNAMSGPDRQSVLSAAPLIRSQAALAGFHLDQGSWREQQIMCPLFPGYLLLSFTRDNGPRDLSIFTAILGPGGASALRILPVLRRSYTSFIPAPSNPRTIAVFNRMREQEHSQNKPDWLVTGLCYAALAGADVELPSPDKGNIPVAMSPLLQVDADGSAVVRFVDIRDPRNFEEWDLSFNPRGKLLKVAVTPTPALKATLLP